MPELNSNIDQHANGGKLIARATISRMNEPFLRGCALASRLWFLVLRLADLRLPFGNSCRLRGARILRRDSRLGLARLLLLLECC